MTVDAFQGRWLLEDSELFEEYMKEAGVGLLTRKAAANIKVTLEIKIENGKFTCNQLSTFKNTSLTFELDKEFDETTPDGRVFKSTVSLQDGKLVHVQKPVKADQKGSTITRYLEGETLVTTMTCGSVTSKRIYKKET